MENESIQMPEDTELPEEESPEAAPSAEQSALDFQGLGTGEQQQQPPAAEPAPPDPLTQLNAFDQELARGKLVLEQRKQGVLMDKARGQISTAEALMMMHGLAQEDNVLQQYAAQSEQQRTSIEKERAREKEREVLGLIPSWTDKNVRKTECNYMTAYLSKKEGRTVTATELENMTAEQIVNVRNETIAAANAGHEQREQLKRLQERKQGGKYSDPRDQMDEWELKLGIDRAEKERAQQLAQPKQAATPKPGLSDSDREELRDFAHSVDRRWQPTRQDVIRATRQRR